MILSFTKIKYMVLTKVMQKILWFKFFLKELKLIKKFTTIFLFNNNTEATALTKNLKYESQIKYIEIKWH